MPFYPRLAVAPDKRVLVAWSACPSVKACPGTAPGVTLAWRTPAAGFGRPHRVSAAPEGSVPSFDVSGQAYLSSSCSGRILLAAPASHSFRRVITLARGAVRELSLGLSGSGEGLASWIPTACSTDRGGWADARPGAREPTARRQVRRAERAHARRGEHRSQPIGRRSRRWDRGLVARTSPAASLRSRRCRSGPPPRSAMWPPRWPPTAPETWSWARRTGRSTRRRSPSLPAGGGAPQVGAGLYGEVASASFGRGAAHAWAESGGPLQLSVWRP